jgi:hypothetical protein
MPDGEELTAPPPNSDPTPPDQPTDPGHPGLPAGAKGTVRKTEQKPDKCGPTKTITWTFTDGKHTTTVVEEFEYEGDPPNCKVIKHVSYTYTVDDSGSATLTSTTATGKPAEFHPKKDKHRKIRKWYKWVWKKGENEPQKFVVTEITDGDVTTTYETPVK